MKRSRTKASNLTFGYNLSSFNNKVSSLLLTRGGQCFKKVCTLHTYKYTDSGLLLNNKNIPFVFFVLFWSTFHLFLRK